MDVCRWALLLSILAAALARSDALALAGPDEPPRVGGGARGGWRVMRGGESIVAARGKRQRRVLLQGSRKAPAYQESNWIEPPPPAPPLKFQLGSEGGKELGAAGAGDPSTESELLLGDLEEEPEEKGRSNMQSVQIAALLLGFWTVLIVAGVKLYSLSMDGNCFRSQGQHRPETPELTPRGAAPEILTEEHMTNNVQLRTPSPRRSPPTMKPKRPPAADEDKSEDPGSVVVSTPGPHGGLMLGIQVGGEFQRGRRRHTVSPSVSRHLPMSMEDLETGGDEGDAWNARRQGGDAGGRRTPVLTTPRASPSSAHGGGSTARRLARDSPPPADLPSVSPRSIHFTAATAAAAGGMGSSSLSASQTPPRAASIPRGSAWRVPGAPARPGWERTRRGVFRTATTSPSPSLPARGVRGAGAYAAFSHVVPGVVTPAPSGGSGTDQVQIPYLSSSAAGSGSRLDRYRVHPM